MIKSDRKDYVLLQKVSILNKKCYLLFLIIISIKYTFYTRTESQSMEKIKGTNKKDPNITILSCLVRPLTYLLCKTVLC